MFLSQNLCSSEYIMSDMETFLVKFGHSLLEIFIHILVYAINCYLRLLVQKHFRVWTSLLLAWETVPCCLQNLKITQLGGALDSVISNSFSDALYPFMKKAKNFLNKMPWYFLNVPSSSINPPFFFFGERAQRAEFIE